LNRNPNTFKILRSQSQLQMANPPNHLSREPRPRQRKRRN